MTQYPPQDPRFAPQPPDLPPQGYPEAYLPPPTGLAVAAMVLGICSIIPFLGLVCGVVAIVLGAIAISKNPSAKGKATAGIVLGFVGIGVTILMIFATVFPALTHAKALARSAGCKMNLSSISKSCILYSSSYNDQYPASFELLRATDGLQPKLLQCPSVEGSADPNRCDYFLCAPKEGGACDSRTLLLAELRANHEGKRNVATVGGIINELNQQQFQQELDKPFNKDFKEKFLAAGGQL